MHNCININCYGSYILQIDYNQAETRIQIIPNFQRYLYFLAIDNLQKYAPLELNREIRDYANAKDSL